MAKQIYIIGFGIQTWYLFHTICSEPHLTWARFYDTMLNDLQLLIFYLKLPNY